MESPEERLYGLQRFGVKLGLENMRALARLQGDPQERFLTVLVGGTNGKGSVCAFLAEILRRAGYRVGLYTSPHLEDFRERIVIDGEPISVPELVGGAEEVLVHVEALRGRGNQCTFFEATTALAFSRFARAGVDVAVVEVGMGGRLDATNIVSPLVSVITNVTLEHTDRLGPTVEAIAGEKAGIIRTGGKVVTCASGPALDVIRGAARASGAALHAAGDDFTFSSGGMEFNLTIQNLQSAIRIQGLRPSLAGRHQHANAAAAAVASLLCRPALAVGEEHIREGISGARLAGRLEVVSNDPQVVLDCAHNPGAAEALAAALADRDYFRFEGLALVVGMLGDKDVEAFMGHIAPLSRRIVATTPASDRAAPADRVAAAARRASPGADVTVVKTVSGAVESALGILPRGWLLCVTGSLYTVGEARGWLRGWRAR